MRDTDWRPSPCPRCGEIRDAAEKPICKNPLCGGNQGRLEKLTQRYNDAAHRVQTAIAYYPDRPHDPYKDLRVGIDMSKSDASGLAALLIKKGLFTMEEYFQCIVEAAEREANTKEDELSIRMGTNVVTR